MRNIRPDWLKRFIFTPFITPRLDRVGNDEKSSINKKKYVLMIVVSLLFRPAENCKIWK